MPSGRTHTRVNLFVLPVLLLLLVFYGITSKELLLWFAGGFLFGTYLLTPDLDTASSAYYNWGPLRVLWYPYQTVVPHRSVLSHSIILGDAIRLVYLLIIMLPFLYVLNIVMGGAIPELVRTHKLVLGSSVAGVCTASALHIILDVTNTKRKRMFRSKKRRR